MQAQGGAAPANATEYEAAARAVLPRDVYDYYAGGAEDELTLAANRAAFGRYAFRPRALVDVSGVDPSVELLGARLPFPLLLAPTAFQRLAHAEGELATAAAASATGVPLVASTLATISIEEVGAACRAPLWFQLYVYRDRGLTRALVERAEAAGCSALCLTVTVPVQGSRERDTRNAFRLPAGIEMANFAGLPQARMPTEPGSGLAALIAREFDPSLDWSALEWLRSITRLPIVVKGVMRGDDAARAAAHGAAAVIVSNHGGRQLDGAQATLDALPDVVDGAGSLPVLVDGGVRRGADAVRALCLGARAVLIGRPYLWALAVGGAAGVEALIRMLEADVRRTMMLLGVRTAAGLGRDALARAGEPGPLPP